MFFFYFGCTQRIQLNSKKSVSFTRIGLSCSHFAFVKCKAVFRVSICIEQPFASDRPNTYQHSAIPSLKTDKASVTDKLHREILKIICEIDNNFLHTVIDPFNDIHNKEKFLKDCHEFITIPKEVKTRMCDEHRLISLSKHMIKAFNSS